MRRSGTAGDRHSWHGGSPSPETPCGAKRARPRPAAGSQAAALSGEETGRGEARPPEGTAGIEGADILSYLRDTLPKLADTTFDPPLEFQRAHRLGLKRQNGKNRPHPIIACFLRHGQARQLLQTTQTQGPLRLGSLEIRLSADFSKETADRRRAFLSLCTRLRHLDVKFGLFEQARMWITENGESRTFYDPEDLKIFLEGLHDPTQPMEAAAQFPQDTQGQARGAGQPETVLDTNGRSTTDPQARGRDLERLANIFDDRAKYYRRWRCTHSCRTEINPDPL
ncbi:hypothetical protein NDU88_001395 [Pleurodeles waltl]|uniref:Uncharacterized protein n=1 Tax=Pleurodeles waltl TaxID=8319 RepID=A0AAV7LB60_PLEWA|nr:hypothetical protein NDU88_001395 [Pleurodeles waltl]